MPHYRLLFCFLFSLFLILPAAHAQNKKQNDMLSIDGSTTYKSRDYSVDKFHIPIWKRIGQKVKKIAISRAEVRKIKQKQRTQRKQDKEEIRAGKQAQKEIEKIARQQEKEKHKNWQEQTKLSDKRAATAG